MDLSKRSRIRDVAEISAGVYLQSVAYGTVACLQASDFGKDGLLAHQPQHVFALSARQERNLLREGDVLLTTKGVSHRAFLFPVSAGPAVAGTAFTVLRLGAGAGLEPAFLVWWLNTPEMQATLRLQAMGSGIPSIGKEAVADLEVPIPALAEQQLIVRIQRLADEELRLRLEIAEKRNLFIAHQLLQSIKH